MLQVEYEVGHFQSLLDFSDARKARSMLDEDALWALGSILCDHELNELFGVVLLHKHFDMAGVERCIKRFMPGLGAIGVEPRSRAHAPCTWKFDPHERRLMAVEFGDGDANPQALIAADLLRGRTAFQQEFARCLQRYDAASVYGLASLYGTRILDPGPDQTVLESTVSARELKLQLISAEELGRIETAETLWIFSRRETAGSTACPIIGPDGDGAAIGAHCYCHCKHHCPVGPIGCGK